MTEWKSAICLLVNPADRRVLAMSRGNDLNNLGLPGGRREQPDRTAWMTASRELLEETGLSALNGQEIYFENGVPTFWVPEWRGRLQDMTDEGLAIWVPPEILLRRCSQYHAYFGRMLRAARAKSIL